MTIAEHIYAIQNIINRGQKSDDSRFSNKLILHYMNVSRLLLFKRELDKKKFINPSNYQGFCMPLCEDTWANCCGIPDIGCPILKSKIKIPRAITGRTNLYIKVSYLSGQEIDRTTHRAVISRKYSLVKCNRPSWFILNDYLYVQGIPNNILKSVWVDGLFEDPTDIAEIATCEEDNSCFDINTEDYPVEGYLIDAMYKMVLQYLGIAHKYPEDNINNAKATEVINDKET